MSKDTMVVNGKTLPYFTGKDFEQALLYVLALRSNWSAVDASIPYKELVDPVASFVLPNETGDLAGSKQIIEDYGIQASSKIPQVRRWVQFAFKNLKKVGKTKAGSGKKGEYSLTPEGLQEALEHRSHYDAVVSNTPYFGQLLDPQAEENMTVEESTAPVEVDPTPEPKTEIVEILAEVSDVTVNADGTFSFEEKGEQVVQIRVESDAPGVTVDEDPVEETPTVVEEPVAPEPPAEDSVPQDNSEQEDLIADSVLDSVFEQVEALPEDDPVEEQPEQEEPEVAIEAELEIKLEEVPPTKPLASEVPTVEDALLFAYAYTVGFRVDGKLIKIEDILSLTERLIGEHKPPQFTFAVLDARSALKADGCLEGVDAKSDVAALTEKGRERADRLGDKFFDSITDRLHPSDPAPTPKPEEVEVAPEQEPEQVEPEEVDPYEGEQGLTESPLTFKYDQPEIPAGIIWDDSYIRSQFIANSECFGINFHHDCGECAKCLASVQCYNATVVSLHQVAQHLPIEVYNAPPEEYKGKYYTLGAVQQMILGNTQDPFAICLESDDGTLVQYQGQGHKDVVVTTVESNGETSHTNVTFADAVEAIKLGIDGDMQYVPNTIDHTGKHIHDTSTIPNKGGDQAVPMSATIPTGPQVPADTLAYSLSQARNRAMAGKAWKIHLELVDPANKHDNLFYECSGVGMASIVVRYGTRGHNGRTLTGDWGYVSKNIPKKLAKGYVYVAGTVDKVNVNDARSDAGVAEVIQQLGAGNPVSPTPPSGAPPAPDKSALVSVEITSQENVSCHVCGQKFKTGEVALWDALQKQDNDTAYRYHDRCLS